jgi:hypothetical protein
MASTNRSSTSAWYARRVSASELNEHGSYVSDTVKIDAYRRALRTWSGPAMWSSTWAAAPGCSVCSRSKPVPPR